MRRSMSSALRIEVMASASEREQRAAFSALFEFGGDLRTMPPQGNVAAAADNAARFTKAVYDRLTEKRA